MQDEIPNWLNFTKLWPTPQLLWRPFGGKYYLSHTQYPCKWLDEKTFQ